MKLGLLITVLIWLAVVLALGRLTIYHGPFTPPEDAEEAHRRHFNEMRKHRGF